MAQNISLWSATYSDVPAVDLPKSGGGTARFTDASITTAVEADVASGKIFIKADGSQGVGTATGGGSVTQDQDGYIILPSNGEGGGGGGSKQEVTGTITGAGTNILQIPCAFEPQEIYIRGDLTGDVSLRGIVSFVLIKDRELVITQDSSTSEVVEYAGIVKPISGYNEENSSTEPYASYSNGVLTIDTVMNSGSARWSSGISYSYSLVTYESVVTYSGRRPSLKNRASDNSIRR